MSETISDNALEITKVNITSKKLKEKKKESNSFFNLKITYLKAANFLERPISYIKNSLIKNFFIPKLYIILLIIITRIFLLLFTHWPLDFDSYITIVQQMSAGKKLYTDIHSTHMPVVDLLYFLMYYICPLKTNIICLRFFLKFPLLLADIGIAILCMEIIKENQKKKDTINHQFINIAGLLVAIAPPLILQTGGGRYDPLMIFSFTFIIYALQKENWFAIAFFISLATTTKYLGIIVLPFLLIWIQKQDIPNFLLGLIIGFLPILPFLIFDFNGIITLFYRRGTHIAYGFSIWHLLAIIKNNFTVQYVDSIETTYTSNNEPWYVKNLYLPMFLAMYVIFFIIYFINMRKITKKKVISDQPLDIIVDIIFIPLFIFSITFKAINIQVLSWFIPYVALKRRLFLLLEFSFLTLLHGLALILIELSNPLTFEVLASGPLASSSLLHLLLINFLHFLFSIFSVQVFVVTIIFSISYFFIRCIIEMHFCFKELFSQYKLICVEDEIAI